jgi:hypothetical protein
MRVRGSLPDYFAGLARSRRGLSTVHEDNPASVVSGCSFFFICSKEEMNIYLNLGWGWLEMCSGSA